MSERTTLDAKLIMEIAVDCPKVIDVGPHDSGYLRVIPIRGGTVKGEINGTVLDVGADWNLAVEGAAPEEKGAASLSAKYVLQTDDDVRIIIDNRAYFRMKDDEDRFIKTRPIFQAPKGKYEWLNYGVFVGNINIEPAERGILVRIKVFQML